MLLALETNMALARRLVSRAIDVSIELAGNARAVVRLARLRGLICVVKRAARADVDAVIAISGPLALFRKTVVYGRALAALVPGLTWCDRFRLRARCLLDDHSVPVEIRSGDPLLPSNEPRRFDSKLEDRFFREFSKAAPEWTVIREPEPIETARGFIFPDFALQHRRDNARRWILEIVGFWTRDYLQNKLDDLRSAKIDKLIVCVDAGRKCDDSELPESTRIVRYRRRIDPKAILSIVEPRDRTGSREKPVMLGARTEN